MTEIPNLYAWLGTLIVANIGVIITIIYAVGKLIWYMSKQDSRMEAVEEKTSFDGPIMKDINAAHAAIREIKQDLTN